MEEENVLELGTATLKFNSVTFINLPVEKKSGEIIGYPLMSAAVAEEYANSIPEADRAAITVDFSELNVEKLMQAAKDELGISPKFESEAEYIAAEAKIIKIFTQLGLFPNSENNE